MSFSINILPQTFETTIDSVIGVIYVQADNYAFPDDSWADFGVTILGWWLSEVSSLTLETRRSCSCKFMDGNFRFDIERVSNDKWRLTFVEERGRGDKIEFQTFVAPQNVVDALLSGANTVSKMCRDKGWLSPDLELLEKNRDELIALQKQIPSLV